MCLCSLYVCATRESCLGCGTYRTNPSVPFEEKIFDKDSPLCPGEPLLLLPLVPAEHRPLGHVPTLHYPLPTLSNKKNVPTLTYHQSLQSLPLSLSSCDRTTDWIQTEHFQYHTSVNWKCSTLPSAPVVPEEEDGLSLSLTVSNCRLWQKAVSIQAPPPSPVRSCPADLKRQTEAGVTAPPSKPPQATKPPTQNQPHALLSDTDMKLRIFG